ncbi:MAG: hypothetical protein LBD33_02650 [Puniceicoccales bacterium]|nr:hypothetical protein [Puniceicoccales bacterium]
MIVKFFMLQSTRLVALVAFDALDSLAKFLRWDVQRLACKIFAKNQLTKNLDR